MITTLGSGESEPESEATDEATQVVTTTQPVPVDAAPGDRDYTFRYWNPDEPSMSGEYPQRITVTG